MRCFTLSLLFAFITQISAFSQSRIEVLKIRQSGCMGTCPVYEVTLSRTGLLVYEGIKFTDSVGKYTIEVGAKHAKRILKRLEKNGVMNLPESYPIKVSDMPMTFYAIKTRTTEKTINRADSGPDFLNKTLEDINKLSKRNKWKKVAL